MFTILFCTIHQYSNVPFPWISRTACRVRLLAASGSLSSSIAPVHNNSSITNIFSLQGVGLGSASAALSSPAVPPSPPLSVPSCFALWPVYLSGYKFLGLLPELLRLSLVNDLIFRFAGSSSSSLPSLPDEFVYGNQRDQSIYAMNLV